jgi:dienelactone hydrolase
MHQEQRAMIPEKLIYNAEGRSFDAEFYAPADGTTTPAPGILVCHDGAGLGDHARGRARRLAALGFAALAPDLYGEPLTGRARGIAMISALVADAPRLRGRVRSALDLLASQASVDGGRLAAIGFCFGGAAALELARDGANLAAVVAFHGGLRTTSPARPGAVRATILACCGAADPHIDADQRAQFAAEMTAAGADWTLCLFGGAQHAFTQDSIDPDKFPGSAYHADADRRSWQVVLGLFAERLSRPEPRPA